MRQILALLTLSAAMMALGGCVQNTDPDVDEDEESEMADAKPIEDKVLVPTIQQASNYAGPSGQAGTAMVYHGGPIMSSPINAYYIWYGNWNGNTAPTVLNAYATGVGGSAYWNINSTYKVNNVPVSSSVTLAKSINDNYSKGSNLTDNGIKAVVSNAISSGNLPKDTNGVYFVLTSKDVTAVSGFCTKYCGWHTHASISGSDIKYSFVGNPERCPNACAPQTTSPNDNYGADGMASIVAHELEEAASDPDLNAWYDGSGYENADKCAWTFGSTSTAANGSAYNLTLNGTKFLIQQNWVNTANGYCAMGY